VFDPTKDDDIEPVCGDLLDDLGDIYKDLKNSLLLFDKGTPAEIESAVLQLARLARRQKPGDDTDQ
jgi:hypothetical protein